MTEQPEKAQERHTREGQSEHSEIWYQPPSASGLGVGGKSRSSLEGKGSTQLEEEIVLIREQMDSTWREIERRFSTGALLDQAIQYIRGGPGEYVDNLGRALKENPIPATMVGIGLTWLMSSSRPYHQEPGKSAAVRERAEKAKGRLHETASRIHEKASHVSHSVGEKIHGFEEKLHGGREKLHDTREGIHEKREEWAATAHHVGDRAKSGLNRANQLYHDQPLVLGAIGIALGAVLGAALPSTRKEDELLGPERDRILAQAKDTGRRQMEKGRVVAERAFDAAREETERQLH